MTCIAVDMATKFNTSKRSSKKLAEKTIKDYLIILATDENTKTCQKAVFRQYRFKEQLHIHVNLEP